MDMSLKEYIETILTEAVSSGRSKSASVEYISISESTKFNDFIGILDDLGYRDMSPSGGYASETITIQNMFDLVTKDKSKKCYAIQNLKSIGCFRVVLYSGKSIQPVVTVCKVDFFIIDYSMYANDIEKYYVDVRNSSVMSSEDIGIGKLVKYIKRGEK